MSVKSDIELLISKNEGEVLNTPLILVLLRIYSFLYLNGAQPRACGQCQKSYLSEIKANGLKKLETMEKNLEKTCQLKTTDLIYINAMHMHVSNINITDEMAVECLKKGWLKDSDFEKLPEIAAIEPNKVVLKK